MLRSTPGPSFKGGEDKSRFDVAFGYALKSLAAHEKFSAEIVELLRKKGIEGDTIEKVLSHLQAKNILNDRRCATLAIERLSNGKPIGRERIKQKLLARHAPEELIEELLPVITADLQGILTKKFPKGATAENATRFLYSRGFREDEIESAVDEFLQL